MPSVSRVNSVLLATPYSTLHLIRRPRPGPLFDTPPSAFFLGYWFQARVRWFAKWPTFPVCFTPRGRREQIGTKSGFWALEGGLYCCHVLACWDVPELVFSFSWFDKVRELIYKDLCRFSFGGVFGSQNIAAKGNSTLRRCYWSLPGGITSLPYPSVAEAWVPPLTREQKRNGIGLWPSWGWCWLCIFECNFKKLLKIFSCDPHILVAN